MSSARPVSGGQSAAHCAECGSALPPAWPKALCRRCALAGALEPDADLPLADECWPAPDTLVDGRFSLRRVIGKGGISVVWLAHDQALDEFVALKFLAPSLPCDDKTLSDLRRETVQSRRLAHPNIIRIYDFHLSPGHGPYISMEYARGATLEVQRHDWKERRCSWSFLQPVILQLCSALQHAHSEQIIHRDLKPANLIVDSTGRLKLADFGIAAFVPGQEVRISAAPDRTGTPYYMSPQQLSGFTPQPTDDFYSLGATLYDLLSGTPPFEGPDLQRAIRETMPEPLRSRLRSLGLRREVPPHIEALIMACLSKRPERRPRSAKMVSDWIGTKLRVPGLYSRLRGWYYRRYAISRPGGQS